MSISLAADIWSAAVVINEIFGDEVPSGYYAHATLTEQFGKSRYPLWSKMTLLKLLLWECLQVQLIKRPNIEYLSEKF